MSESVLCRKVPQFATSAQGVLDQMGSSLNRLRHQWSVAEELSKLSSHTAEQKDICEYFRAVMGGEPGERADAMRDLRVPMEMTDSTILLTLLPETEAEALAVGMKPESACLVEQFHLDNPSLLSAQKK